MAKITKKSVYENIESSPKENLVIKRKREKELLFQRMQYSIQHKYRLLFLDEIIFQNHDNKMKAFSSVGNNIQLNKNKRFQKNVTVIAVVDQNGLVHHKRLNGFVDGKIYQSFLYELYEIVGPSKVAILFDGLSVHKMKMSWQLILIEFSWIGMLNVAYSPKQNPIELYFSMVKRKYRKLLLQNFSLSDSAEIIKAQINMDKLVDESFKYYQNYDCKAIIKKSIKEIEYNSKKDFIITQIEEDANKRQELLEQMVQQELE